MFTVVLHHLSPDGKNAGVEFPDRELKAVIPEKLHALIAALAALAPRDNGRATPELRIAAEHGRFVVQVAEGQLRFNSWTTRVGGFDLTAEQIFGIITGIEEPEKGGGSTAAVGPRQRARWWRLGFLVLAIAGSNAVTAWMLLRPTPNPFLPEYRLLEAAPAERLLNSVVGDYETGTIEGDRRLHLTKDGRIHWEKLGPGGVLLEPADLTFKAAESRGHPALLTNVDALIDVADGGSLVFYGDTYRRRLK